MMDEQAASRAARNAPVVRLRASRRAMVSPQELCALLRDASWLGSPVDYPEGGPEVRRYLTDLALPLSAGGGRVEVRKAAYVDIGPIRPTERGCEVHIAWRSATLAPLFPVFAGRLWVDAH